MKIKVNKSLRITLIIMLAIITFGTSFLIYQEINRESYKTEEISIYSYRHKALVSYKVHLKPNILFETDYQGEGEVYFSEFVERMSVDFSYGFLGERDTSFSGDQEIIAILEGFSKELDGEKIVWRKNFIISSMETFDAVDMELLGEKEISLDLNDFNNFAKEVSEAIKVRASTRLIVAMNVHINAVTDAGSVEEKMTSLITIPLDQPQFTIEKTEVPEKNGSINEAIQKKESVNKIKVYSYGGCLGLAIIILVLLIFFTSKSPEKTELQKILNRIFKNHNTRLVALVEETNTASEEIYKVKSIDDLVKIADEIEKPIMYHASIDLDSITQFFIIDGKLMYILDLSQLIEKAVLEKEPEISIEG